MPPPWPPCSATRTTPCGDGPGPCCTPAERTRPYRRNCSASGEVLAAALSLLDGDHPADEHTRHDLRRFLRSLDDPHEPARYEAVLGLQRWADATGTLPPDETDNARRRLTALTEDVSP
ncbi:hypothetical protein UK15_22940 [Streptomyces variegatus]|uniref:Uncharacterized protein n=1 Tax=Streptomyces variegatus TaxID=284040 RepID=A0A0M2GPK8_9ACTN|nr:MULTISPECIES: hypothetical protein [Streptomyces]KJK37241.1 hypothetical protein UK15_22940 [Streptomyces variegatus]